MELAAKHEKQHNFQTPLDEIDAAARILDPVLAPLAAAQAVPPGGPPAPEPPWCVPGWHVPAAVANCGVVEPAGLCFCLCRGIFIKDYVKCEW